MGHGERSFPKIRMTPAVPLLLAVLHNSGLFSQKSLSLISFSSQNKMLDFNITSLAGDSISGTLITNLLFCDVLKLDPLDQVRR